MISFEWTVAKFFWYFLVMFLTLFYFTFYGTAAIALTPSLQVSHNCALQLASLTGDC